MILMLHYCGEKSDQEVNGQLGDFKQSIEDQSIHPSFVCVTSVTSLSKYHILYDHLVFLDWYTNGWMHGYIDECMGDFIKNGRSETSILSIR